MAHESWLLTFTVSLTPYYDSIETLENEIDFFAASIDNLTREFDVQEKNASLQVWHLHHDISRLTRAEIDHSKIEINGLRNTYYQISDVFLNSQPVLGDDEFSRSPQTLVRSTQNIARPRHRRSMLPWAGKILSGITGTATEEELDAIRYKISVLSDRTEIMTQVMQDSLTIINTTRADININREAITHLGNVVQTLTERLKKLYSDTILTIQRELLYDQYLNRAHTAFHIITAQLRQVSVALLRVRHQLEGVMHGRLPFDLIPERQLQSFLHQIESSLPPNYLLPYGNKELHPYFTQVPTLLLSSANEVYVTLIIPIAPVASKFTIFEPVTVPRFSPDGQSIQEYILESAALAISQDGYSFRLLSQGEAAICTHNQAKFCKMNDATFRASQSKMCIPALFFKDPEAIMSQCTVMTKPIPKFPIIRYIPDGNWLFFTPESESLQVTCSRFGEKATPRAPIPIQAGVNLIALPPHCEARSRIYSLPAFSKNETTVEVKQAFQLEVIAMKNLGHFWNNSIQLPQVSQFPQLPDAPPDLPPISDMSSTLELLRSRLIAHVVQENQKNNKYVFAVLTVVGVGLFAIFLVALFLMFMYNKRLQSKFQWVAHTLKGQVANRLLGSPRTMSRMRRRAAQVDEDVDDDSDFDDSAVSDADMDRDIPLPQGVEDARPEYVNMTAMSGPEQSPKYREDAEPVTYDQPPVVPPKDLGSTWHLASPKGIKRQADSPGGGPSKAVRFTYSLCPPLPTKGTSC